MAIGSLGLSGSGAEMAWRDCEAVCCPTALHPSSWTLGVSKASRPSSASRISGRCFSLFCRYFNNKFPSFPADVRVHETSASPGKLRAGYRGFSQEPQAFLSRQGLRSLRPALRPLLITLISGVSRQRPKPLRQALLLLSWRRSRNFWIPLGVKS